MILAHRLASGPDAFGQNLTRPSRQIQASFAQYDLGLFGKNRTELDTGSQIWHIQSDCILAAYRP